MAANDIAARINLEGFSNIPRMEFKRPAMRKAFRNAGQAVRKDARKRISGRGVLAGEYPARRTGRLRRSMAVRVGSRGMYAKVYHRKLPDQKHFYAAFLHYGTKRGLKPRKNWISGALDDRASEIREILHRGMLEALA